MEIAIPLEAKVQRSKAEDETLGLNKKLIDVTNENQQVASTSISILLCFGIILSTIGAQQWHQKVQLRDDKLAILQIEKLEAEILKLRAELASPIVTEPTVTQDETKPTHYIE